MIILALIFSVIAIIAFIIINLSFGNFGKTSSEKIFSFDEINIKISGMRLTSKYKIINKGEKTEIFLYHKNYSDGEERPVLEKTAETETEEFIEFLNFCNFGSWNGFYGEHPKNVRDGIMFNLTATINEGEILKAEGSENFPDGYRDFIKELGRLLSGGE